jgi:hypothetical protein
MKVESLDELGAAVAEWRGKKRHVREATPRDLLDRARRASRVHGWGAVSRATKIDRRHLVGIRGTRGSGRRSTSTHARHKAPKSVRPSSDLKHKAKPPRVPSFSRLSIEAPRTTRVLAEIEMPHGHRLRIFEPTPELLGLVSSLCSSGGER